MVIAICTARKSALVKERGSSVSGWNLVPSDFKYHVTCIYFILDLSGKINYPLRRKFNKVKDDIIEAFEYLISIDIDISYSFEDSGYNKICIKNFPVMHIEDKEKFILTPDGIKSYELSSILYRILLNDC